MVGGDELQGGPVAGAGFLRHVVGQAARELARDGQVFFVHNRIGSIYSVYDLLRRIVPEARIGVAHGEMPERELEITMRRFQEREIDILLSTMIIENGLDFPNANTIIVDEADIFGLADLHQLRGRVGRGQVKAYCYLLIPHRGVPGVAMRRLDGDGVRVGARVIGGTADVHPLSRMEKSRARTIGFGFLRFSSTARPRPIRWRVPRSIADPQPARGAPMSDAIIAQGDMLSNWRVHGDIAGVGSVSRRFVIVSRGLAEGEAYCGV